MCPSGQGRGRDELIAVVVSVKRVSVNHTYTTYGVGVLLEEEVHGVVDVQNQAFVRLIVRSCVEKKQRHVVCFDQL